jgi:hypothetical protein
MAIQAIIGLSLVAHLPFTGERLMKISLFLSLIVFACMLIFALPGFAIEVANITDSTCTTIDVLCASAGDDGCTSTTFTVEHSGDYTLTASIDNCSGSTACTGCRCEAYIYKQDTPPSKLACVNTTCCMTGSTTASLTTSVTYILYCCKVPCTVTDCAGCNTSCVARATVTQ